MPLSIFDLLSLRTFSSVWYWIAVAIVWSVVSHRPMGVPYDMVWRARRSEEQALTALETVARAFAWRLVQGMASGGAVFVGLVSAALTSLLLLAVVYGVEVAQGLVLIALPLSCVGWLTFLAARHIDGGRDPVRELRSLRAWTQTIALVALFVTAFWGMYVNLEASVL